MFHKAIPEDEQTYADKCLSPAIATARAGQAACTAAGSLGLKAPFNHFEPDLVGWKPAFNEVMEPKESCGTHSGGGYG